MLENRSFDHMLGSLAAVDPRIDGVTAGWSNPDTKGAAVSPEAQADFQGQLDPDPDHHFPAVDIQIFGGDNSPGRVANMQGFVKSYFNQRRDVAHSHKIMYYFAQDKLPVLTTLALEFAVFNRWFASIPGPTVCNRAFAHFGTSFGRVDMNPFYVGQPIPSVYQRLIHATPTGMAGHPGLAFDPSLLRPEMWVAEIVYFPLETELLRAARKRGCRTPDGLLWFPNIRGIVRIDPNHVRTNTRPPS
jgi:hypothetical protein